MITRRSSHHLKSSVNVTKVTRHYHHHHHNNKSSVETYTSIHSPTITPLIKKKSVHHRTRFPSIANIFNTQTRTNELNKSCVVPQNYAKHSKNNSDSANGNNSRINTHNDISPVDALHIQQAKKKKKQKYKYCTGFRLRALLCMFGTIILGALVAAIIIAILSKSITTNITSITTVSTTIITTTTESTSTTTTTPPLFYISLNESVNGIWNTTVGGDSTASVNGTSAGNYVTGEEPNAAFDRNTSTKYTSFGSCSIGVPSIECGVNTGLYITPQSGASLITGLRFCTGNDYPERDPLTVSVEGSNHTSALTFGTSWTVIYNGTTGLDVDPGRATCGVTQLFLNNPNSYLSYRILLSSKRGIDYVLQYSEIELLGY
ncbi:unnamed protein product [Adineta steineri]|uniref:Uncharacterized protein n=1 Tax=Adineta steineri TaxID=433720 RepID=A0A813VI56_9BILA|nr:unnamed protein product [Adineta steineri]CAF0872574.1 unnamed protein product [Adineta steineri]CAF3714583.1 unnamed protein product [Adineta steineri]CAF3867747.1 unnamed protein product [Adineta steineri]